jgi:hypothetical protein
MKMSDNKSTLETATNLVGADVLALGEVDPFAQRPRRKKTPGSGRRKGSLNKKTLERRALMAAVRASGQSPLTFFAQLLRTETNPIELRFAAARELLPYMHPKLASIESRTGGRTHEDRLRKHSSCSAMID